MLSPCFSPEGSAGPPVTARGVQVDTLRLWDGEAYRAETQAGLVEKRAIRRELAEIMPLPRDVGMGRQCGTLAIVDHVWANTQDTEAVAIVPHSQSNLSWRAPNFRWNAMPSLLRPIQQSYAAT
ncbi:hypothetical protein DHEL01_v205389 [Diaporthe helianthi]|uniref:Uncharacterized protein n=1 Tax=Diaporthe helianthi TaxID=158607 RepID=A0A2P5I160_DIAHE|nr:hypothetical protein DHEL01_v205389 [Diaporthe helianthi]